MFLFLFFFACFPHSVWLWYLFWKLSLLLSIFKHWWVCHENVSVWVNLFGLCCFEIQCGLMFVRSSRSWFSLLIDSLSLLKWLAWLNVFTTSQFTFWPKLGYLIIVKSMGFLFLWSLFVFGCGSVFNLFMLLFRVNLKSPWSRRRRKHALLPKQWKRFFTPDGKLIDGGVKFLKKVRSGVRYWFFSDLVISSCEF